MIKILENVPYIPLFEKLIGDLEGIFYRRINIQHRLIYEILEEDKIVKIIRMWSRYGR